MSESEWLRYQTIMQHQGQYFWKHLDPITVLGLNANNDAERKRYAELLAQQEFENTRKIQLLDTAYNEAFNRLYGHIPIINLAQLNPGFINTGSDLLGLTSRPDSPSFEFNRTYSGQSGDRYLAFINAQCQACDELVDRVRQVLPLGVSLDVHFRSDSRDTITAWASKRNISAAAVEAGRVTLNPNSELYARFQDPPVPSLYFYNQSSNKVERVE